MSTKRPPKAPGRSPATLGLSTEEIAKQRDRGGLSRYARERAGEAASIAPATFAGGALVPGDRGYARRVAGAVPGVADVLVRSYGAAMWSPVAPPAGGRGVEACRRFNASVPHVNAWFGHLARLDALHALLGFDDPHAVGEAMIRAIDAARHLSVAAPAPAAAPVGAGVAHCVARSIEAIDALLGAFFASERHAELDDAVAALLDVPGRLVHVDADRFAGATAARILAACSDPDVATAGAGAADALRALQASVVGRRRDYRELGEALDRAAGDGVERFAPALVVVGQTREVVAIASGVAAAVPRAVDLDTEAGQKIDQQVAALDGAIATVRAACVTLDTEVAALWGEAY